MLSGANTPSRSMSSLAISRSFARRDAKGSVPISCAAMYLQTYEHTIHSAVHIYFTGHAGKKETKKEETDGRARARLSLSLNLPLSVCVWGGQQSTECLDEHLLETCALTYLSVRPSVERSSLYVFSFRHRDWNAGLPRFCRLPSIKLRVKATYLKVQPSST